MRMARFILSALVCWTMLACATSTLATAQTPPSDGPSVMIIFDGSGSMWGRLDGDKKLPKLDLAREALRTAMAKAPATARYGLMSFGHRRAADCSDIELISPIATGDLGRIMAPLEKLNPRGKGPIAGALKEAAKAIGTNPQSSILLIHDNADNCRQDPCETVTEIAAANPKLKIHLVSLGIEKEELARIVCVPKATGGQLFDVKDASGITAAFADAVALAFLDPANPQGVIAAPAAAQKPSAPSAAPAGPPGLRLIARLGAKSGPLAYPVRWRVFKSETEPPVFEGQGSDVVAPLDAGPYIVEASAGFATARKAATAAEKGPTTADVVLEAAALRVLAKDQKDGPVSSSALVTLRQSAETSGAVARPLWIGRAKDAGFVLPAGAYRLKVTDSLIEREDTVTLAAGDMTSRDIVLGAGRLELTATAKPDGEPLDGVTFLIAKDDPDAPEGRREIARSAAIRPFFVLPAGTYYVTARTGAAEVRQRVGIGTGDTVKRAVSLGLARLTVTAGVPAGKNAPQIQIAPAKLPIATRILSLDGEPREVARATAVAPEFTLAAGRYRIEAAVGSFNVKAVQDVDIEAGSTKRAALKLDANTVTLKLAQATPANVTWEVRDAQGALVVRTQQSAPQLILAPGKYTARCEAGDKRLEKPVDVAADGQPRIVEFALP